MVGGVRIMKLIIDIPKKTYDMIMSNKYDYGDMNIIIQNGILFDERNIPLDEDQIKLDELTAKEALKRYLEHYLYPNRNNILENLICELDKEDVISVDWVEIY